MCYLENYAATVGHKMNHCFIPNCTEWFFEHPRYILNDLFKSDFSFITYYLISEFRHGIIPCVVAIHPIKKGEEFFLHYGYHPLNCPR